MRARFFTFGFKPPFHTQPSAKVRFSFVLIWAPIMIWAATEFETLHLGEARWDKREIRLTAGLNANNVESWAAFVMNSKNAVLASVQACNWKVLKARVKVIDAFRSALVFDKLNAGNFAEILNMLFVTLDCHLWCSISRQLIQNQHVSQDQVFLVIDLANALACLAPLRCSRTAPSDAEKTSHTEISR